MDQSAGTLALTAGLALVLVVGVAGLLLMVRSHRQDVRRDVREQRDDLARREQRLAEREAELAQRTAALRDLEVQRRTALERSAGLSAARAREELLATVAADARREAAAVVRDLERRARQEGEARARRIVVDAIQRVSGEVAAESSVVVVRLPAEDMKGRIIGREGRNIRAFEQVTGVNVVVDEAPGTVGLSCFDPVRREVARLALEALVLDGRIHPVRIEAAHEQALVEVQAVCQRAAEEALLAVGVHDLHPELVQLLGRLRLRTSYGQNVLAHLVESARIAGLMAGELGLDPALLRRAALLHDIGKALTHDVDGPHALTGADVARRCGEHPDVVHAIEAHHDDVEPRTVEAVLTQVADALSAARPGARRESVQRYATRLQSLEDIATSYAGVERAFAMAAGRELRVMVLPEAVDDIAAQVLAREIAKQVEHDLTYPGQIRVTVVRESRAVEVAR